MFVIWFAIFNTNFLFDWFFWSNFLILSFLFGGLKRKKCRRTEKYREMTWTARQTKLKELSKEKKQTHKFNNCKKFPLSDAYIALHTFIYMRDFTNHITVAKNSVIHLTKIVIRCRSNCIGGHTIKFRKKYYYYAGLIKFTLTHIIIWYFRYKRCLAIRFDGNVRDCS